MKISSRCDYACRALAELSIHYMDNAPVQISQIAKRQRVPEKYLVHILNQLRRGGLVASKRGKLGGYSLAKKPCEISLADVVLMIDGQMLATRCIDETTKSSCDNNDKCPFQDVWRDVDASMTRLLADITFEDIAGRLIARREETMYHI